MALCMSVVIRKIKHMVGREGTDEIKALHTNEAQAQYADVCDRKNTRKMGKLSCLRYSEEHSKHWYRSTWKTERYMLKKILAHLEVLHHHRQCSILKRQETNFVWGMQATRRLFLELHPYPYQKQNLCNSNLWNHQKAHAISTDLSKYPPLDKRSPDEIVSTYRQLNERMRSEGPYQCPYSSYAFEVARYTTLFILFLTFLHYSYYALSVLSLGLFWHRLAFPAHDAGHMGITHGFHTDTCIGIFIADFLGGLPIGWWKRNHNVHRIVTNSREHDPDIVHMPFFAISHQFFTSLRSTYYD